MSEEELQPVPVPGNGEVDGAGTGPGPEPGGREAEDEEDYTPPETLPIPEREAPGSFPILAVAAGAAAAVGLGLVMFGLSRFVYIYILYNSVIGMAVGWLIGWGVERSRYRSVGALAAAAAVCSFLAYLAFNVAYWQYLVFESAEKIGFLQFLLLRASEEPFIGGLAIGAIGNGLVWLAEYGITVYFAWARVRGALRAVDVEAVPAEVTALVLHYQGEDCDEFEVRRQLAGRGWSDPEDQDRALKAAATLVTMMQDAGEEED